MGLLLAHCTLGVAPVGDVVRKAIEAHQPAGWIEQRPLGAQHDTLAVSAGHLLFEHQRAGAGHHGCVVGGQRGIGDRAEQLDVAAPEDIDRRLADLASGRGVVEDIAALQVLGEDGVQHAQRVQLLALRVALAPRLLQRLALPPQPAAQAQAQAEQGQRGDGSHQPGVAPGWLLDLGQVLLGHQPPVTAAHRSHDGQHRHAAVIAYLHRLTRRHLAAHHQGRRQARRGQQLADLAGAGGLAAHVVEGQQTLAFGLPQHGLAAVTGHRPDGQQREQFAPRIDPQHDQATGRRAAVDQRHHDVEAQR